MNFEYSNKFDSVFHKALEIDICVEIQLYSDFDNANYVAVNEFLSGIDWNTRFSGCDVDACAGIFHQLLCHAVEPFVPLKKRRMCCSRPWLSADLRNLRNVKNRGYKTYLSTLSQSDFLAFSDL